MLWGVQSDIWLLLGNDEISLRTYFLDSYFDYIARIHTTGSWWGACGYDIAVIIACTKYGTDACHFYLCNWFKGGKSADYTGSTWMNWIVANYQSIWYSISCRGESFGFPWVDNPYPGTNLRYHILGAEMNSPCVQCKSIYSWTLMPMFVQRQ